MSPSRASKNELRRRLAFLARQYLGRPYAYGAWVEEAPRRFDCSGFVQYCYGRIGVALPRITIEQARCGRRVPTDANRLKIGDLIFIRGKSGHYDRHFPTGIGHVLMVVDGEEVIHARSRWVRGRQVGRVVCEPLAKILKRPDVVVIKKIV